MDGLEYKFLDLDRRLRALELKRAPSFKHLKLTESDLIKIEDGKYLVKFEAVNKSNVFIELNCRLDLACEVVFSLNDVVLSSKMSDDSVTECFEAQTIVGENLLVVQPLNLNASIIDFNLLVVGDVNHVADNSKLTVVRTDSGAMVCEYNGVKGVARLLSLKDKQLNELYYQENLKGASISLVDGEDGQILFGVLDNDSRFTVKRYAVNSLQVLDEYEISTGVKKIQGTKITNGGAFYFIKNGCVYLASISFDGEISTSSKLKDGVEDFTSSPELEGVIIYIGTNKQAILCKNIGENIDKYSLPNGKNYALDKQNSVITIGYNVDNVIFQHNLNATLTPSKRVGYGSEQYVINNNIVRRTRTKINIF